jgi:phosphohistidine phosphatase
LAFGQLYRHMLDLRARESDIAAMRRLLLLRHAKTERAKPGEHDRGRKLTKRGRADAPVIGAYMARHRLVPDLALVSPAERTQETWKLLADALGKPPKAITDERIYNASADKLMSLLTEPRKARTLLLVGHNPGIHDLAVALIAAGDVATRERVAEKLPTSGLVVIDLAFDDWAQLHPRAGRLERFVSPRLIAAATE